MTSRIDKIKAIWNDERLSGLPGVPEKTNPLDVLSAVLRTDPTPTKKYATWVLSVWEKKQFKWEDIKNGPTSTVGETLALFEERKKLLPPEQRSLMKYKTLDDLWTSVRSMDAESSNKSIKRLDMRRAKLESWEHTFESGLHIIVPMSELASRVHGRNTRWCTAAKYDNAFRNYAKAGVLIIFRLPDGTKFQGYIDENSQIEFLNEGDARPTTKDAEKIAPYREDILRAFENLDMGEWGKASPDVRALVEEKMIPRDDIEESPSSLPQVVEEENIVDIDSLSVNPDIIRIEQSGKITKLIFSGTTSNDVHELSMAILNCLPLQKTANVAQSLKNISIEIPRESVALVMDNLNIGKMPRSMRTPGIVAKVIQEMVKSTPGFYEELHKSGHMFVDGNVERGIDALPSWIGGNMLPGYVNFLKKEKIDMPLIAMRDLNSQIGKQILHGGGIGDYNLSDVIFLEEYGGQIGTYEMHDIYVATSSFIMRRGVDKSLIDFIGDISTKERILYDENEMLTQEEAEFMQYLKAISHLSLYENGDDFIAIDPRLHPDTILETASQSNSAEFKVECGQFIERFLKDVKKTTLSDGLSVFRTLILSGSEDEDVGLRGLETTDDFDDELLSTYHALPVSPEEKQRIITRSVLSEQTILLDESLISALEGLPQNSNSQDYKKLAEEVKKANKKVSSMLRECLDKIDYSESSSAISFFNYLSKDVFYTPLKDNPSIDMEI